MFGLIFLFKWVHDENPQGSLVKDSRVLEMFFAKQVTKICSDDEVHKNQIFNCDFSGYY